MLGFTTETRWKHRCELKTTDTLFIKRCQCLLCKYNSKSNYFLVIATFSYIMQCATSFIEEGDCLRLQYVKYETLLVP